MPSSAGSKGQSAWRWPETFPAAAPRDLAELLARLRTEAEIDISTTNGPATITIEFTSRSDLRRLAPQAACFVVPNVSSLADYRRMRGSTKVDWARVTTRTRAAIFIPTDTSPQEVRDCLHEELAQALGPLNDLYRLSDSVFNDDNFHSVLTGFDMSVLRLTYSPQVTSGMTEAEVGARLFRDCGRTAVSHVGRLGRRDRARPGPQIRTCTATGSGGPGTGHCAGCGMAGQPHRVQLVCGRQTVSRQRSGPRAERL